MKLSCQHFGSEISILTENVFFLLSLPRLRNKYIQFPCLRPDSIDKRILLQLQPPYHEYAQAFLQYFLKGFHAVDSRTHKSSSPP